MFSHDARKRRVSNNKPKGQSTISPYNPNSFRNFLYNLFNKKRL